MINEKILTTKNVYFEIIVPKIANYPKIELRKNTYFLICQKINASNTYSQWAAIPATKPPTVWAPMALPMSLR